MSLERKQAPPFYWVILSLSAACGRCDYVHLPTSQTTEDAALDGNASADATTASDARAMDDAAMLPSDGPPDAESPPMEWVRVVSGTNARVDGIGVAAGQIAVGGSHRGTLDFAGLPHPSVDAQNVFVGALELDGDPAWVRAYGATTQFFLGDLAVAGSGQSYGWGNASGTIAISDMDQRLIGSRQRPILLIHDSAGDLIEARAFTGSGANAQGVGIGVSATGRFALAGLHGGDIDLGGGFVGTGPGDAGFGGGFDADAMHAWSRAYLPSSGTARAVDADIDDLGVSCVVGQYDGATDLGDGAARPRIGNGSGFVASYGPTGEFRWAEDFGSATGNVTVYGVERLADRACVLAGRVQQGDLVIGDLSRAVGPDDLFIARIDEGGEAVWVEVGGGAGDDRFWAVAVDGDRVYGVGTFAGTATIAGRTLTTTGGSDGFIAVYDVGDGTPLGALGFGSEGADGATAIDVVANDGVVVGGYFTGEGTFGSVAASSGGAGAGFVYRFWP